MQDAGCQHSRVGITYAAYPHICAEGSDPPLLWRYAGAEL